MRHRIRRQTDFLRSLMLSLTLLLVGCTGIPEAEFASYLEAVTAARTASESLLVDYDVTRRSVDALDSDTSSAAKAENGDFLANYVPGSPGDNEGSIIESRVQAWDAIARYNEALTALASGESAERLGKRFGTLGSSLQSVTTSLGATVAGFDLLLPTVGQFIVLAERARAISEFEEAIRKARPIIHEMITKVLIPDTTAYAGEKDLLLDSQLLEATRSMQRISRRMARLAREHAEPLVDKHPEQVERRDAVEEEMKTIIGAFNSDVKIKFDNTRFAIKENGLSNYPAPPEGSKPYSELVQSQLEQLLGELRETDKLRRAEKMARVKYKNTLDGYVELLNKVKATMLAIEVQLGKPQNLQGLVTEITTLILKLRSDIELLRKTEAGAIVEPPQTGTVSS